MVVHTDTLYTVVTWQLAERERQAVYNMEKNSVRWAIIFIRNSKTLRRMLNQIDQPTDRHRSKGSLVCSHAPAIDPFLNQLNSIPSCPT